MWLSKDPQLYWLSKKVCKTKLSRTKAGPGRSTKQEQRAKFPNHGQVSFPSPVSHHTGNLYKAVSRLREFCRQVEAEEVSNSRSKIHQTWGRPHRNSLYCNKNAACTEWRMGYWIRKSDHLQGFPLVNEAKDLCGSPFHRSPTKRVERQVVSCHLTGSDKLMPRMSMGGNSLERERAKYKAGQANLANTWALFNKIGFVREPYIIIFLRKPHHS